METLVKIFIVLYLHGIILPRVFGDFTDTSPQDIADGPEDTVDSTVYGTILSPLLKALSEHATWGDFAPKLVPESKYVRYMKRLYRVSSKQKRSKEGASSQLYNTVRLITPRDEYLQQSKEFFMQDLSYNLERVRVNEQLLKSVFLYYFEKDQTSSFTSVCSLDVQEQEHDQQQLYPKKRTWSSKISFPNAMGHHFGDLARIRHGIPNVWRRFTSSVFKVAPPMVLLYITYTWGNHVHEQGKRKDHTLYENDE
ncbi:hypothetical protein SKAU_G00239260 [Synaphobranchus kaupii]|uniref:Cytochrome b-c1 complex subunit 8 n=1 Tax=Synaphobranchus kaupii TaxID=118154 RepID=A0A9Q1IT64_SYNKA|nr:hypothetical protein SKAU_G00239260 [Synaphobranchus kaupii]